MQHAALEFAVDVAFDDFQTCWTPGGQIIPYCLKFLFRMYRFCTAKFNGSCRTHISSVLSPLR